MAQAFVTSYQFFFRGTRQDRAEPINPYKLTEIQPDDDDEYWLKERTTTSDPVDDAYLEEGAKLVKQMLIKRLRTTYQVSYCGRDLDQPKKKDEAELEAKPKGNELLEYCKNLYGRKDQKLLRPLPTSRRIYGYLRASRNFTPLSTYQHEIGRVGYTLLDR